MLLAAHQPNHLPWLGYFHKAASCDRFIHVDHVQFEKQKFQNRTRLLLSDGPHWITVPLAHDCRGQRIDEKRIVEGEWRARTWATIEHAYRRTPHFQRYAEPLQAAYARRWEKLVDLNLHLIELCFGWLEIRVPSVRSSTLGVGGKRTEMIGEMCRAMGADRYLSGAGGSRDYLDVALLAASGIEVDWQSFEHPIYRQLYPARGFVPSLSVLDLLFNCGAESRRILLGSCAAPIAFPRETPKTAIATERRTHG